MDLFQNDIPKAIVISVTEMLYRGPLYSRRQYHYFILVSKAIGLLSEAWEIGILRSREIFSKLPQIPIALTLLLPYI
jgi:hypothetical protein